MIGVLVKMIIFGILARKIVNIEYVDRWVWWVCKY